MIDVKIKNEGQYTFIELGGRLDSMSSPDIEAQVKEAALSGARVMIFSMEDVSYISSAGLRVFMAARRLLSQAGGEVCFFAVSDKLFDVFKMGGFDKIFRFFKERVELEAEFGSGKDALEMKCIVVDDVKIDFIEYKAAKSRYSKIGTLEKLSSSSYDEDDVVDVSPSLARFGFGMAAIGEEYNDYKEYFGEALILNSGLFYYPAIKNPAPDFMLFQETENPITYKFLNGFVIKGDYSVLARFEPTAAFPDLQKLGESLASLSKANVCGLVILAESKGFWGMNLKSVPIRENMPANGDIFSQENFTEWVNFPVEPLEIGNCIVSFGIYIKDTAKAAKDIVDLLPEGQKFKFTTAVFGKELLASNPEKLDDEIKRISLESAFLKVQRMFSKTRFGSGLAGIIDIE